MAQSLMQMTYVMNFLEESHSDCRPVIGGDFNVDRSRASFHTQYLSDFVATHNLQSIGLDARFLYLSIFYGAV
jgi:hypothetical protein